jgi:hypothetical protein
MLIERYTYLGGLATGAVVLWMHDMDDGKEITVAGLVDEFIERLDRLGGSLRPDKEDLFKSATPEMRDKYFSHPLILERVYRGLEDPSNVPYVRHCLFADVEASKFALFQMIEDAGVRLRLHSWFVEPIMEANKVTGVVTMSKEGLQAVKAKVVIDATGDGDVFAAAGSDFVHCRYVASVAHFMSNVDIAKANGFRKKHPDEALKLDTQVSRLYEPKEEDWPADVGGRQVTWWIACANPNVAWCGARPKTADVDALNVGDLTKLEMEGRKRIWDVLDFVRKNYPGFENAYISKTGDQAAVRASRLLVGEYELTLQDMREGKWFEDSIGRGAHYYYPYRSLLPKNVDNLLAVGRCCSTEPAAQHLYRSWPPMMVTGEAAGTAAALAVDSGKLVKEVDVPELQRRLADQGVIL